MTNSLNNLLHKYGGLIAAVFIVFISLVLGGGTSQAGLGQLTMLGLSLMAAVVLVCDRPGLKIVKIPGTIIATIVVILLLPLVQLIPIPPEIWRNLPGREAETAIIDLAGGANLMRPMALDRIVNLQLFASLVVLISFSMIVAGLDDVDFRRLLTFILLIAGCELLIGAAQFSSDGNLFDIYGNSHKGWLLGTFANRNHAGLFFAACILISTALFVETPVKNKKSSLKLSLFTFALLVSLWLLATLGTGSRSGILLALLATALAGVMVLRKVKLPAWTWVGVIVSVSGLAGALLLSDRVQNLLGRYEIVGEDQRWTIWRNSLDIIKSYLPWGSGFGSFPDVYNKYETIPELIPTYVNNAHNDYLELFVEAGVIGGIVLIAVTILVLIGVFKGMRSGDTRTVRNALAGGGVILLFALHSAVDYPARRMGMAVILFLAFGMLLRQFAHRGWDEECG